MPHLNPTSRRAGSASGYLRTVAAGSAQRRRAVGKTYQTSWNLLQCAGASTAWRKKESLLCETFLAYHDSTRSDDAASRVEEPAMPGATPPVVPLSEEERLALHTLIRAHKTPQHLSFRAHVILLLAEGLTAPDVARRLGTTRTTVRR